AGAGTNFQNAIGPFDLGCFRHPCDDERLRDCLAAADWERTVLVGEFLEALIDKCLTSNVSQSGQHPLVAHASPRHALRPSGVWRVRNRAPSAIRAALVMLAFLIFATDHLAVVLVRKVDPLVAQLGTPSMRFPLLFRALQLFLGVEIF